MNFNHLPLTTEDGTQVKLDALYKVAPSCFTEARDEKTGALRHVVDFKKLRQLLGDNAVEDDPEVYEFTWVGKQAARREAATPINKTLRPVPESSVDWDHTQNIYIEGDNLDALKLLQKSYLGKVKMIYIDPPYNTGNDFVYHDDFHRTQAEEDLEAGNVDELGNRFVKNTETNGKFHSDWCSMIYPRLQLARTLLSEEGVIFISIDDNEVDNLRKICDEVFGETNFIGNLVIQTATDNNPRQITTEHEYIICYAKNSTIQKPWKSENEKAELIQDEYLSLKKRYGCDIDNIQKDLRSWIKKNANKLQGVTHYDNVDEKGVFHDGDIANTVFGGYQYDVIHPLTHKPCKRPEKGWRFSEATMKEMISANDIMFGVDETTLIKPKKRLENAKDVLRSVIYEDGRTSTKQFESLMARDIFQNPKSATILQRLISFIVKEGDLVLDFFSGSATTAEALFRFEVKEKIAAHFILVQIKENLDESLKTSDSRSKKTIQNAISFLDSINKPHNICEIGEERIRRAGKKIKEELKAKQPDLFSDGNDDKQPLDTGFRVFRVDSSNMKDVYFAPKDLDPQQLDLFADNVKEDRTELDLLYGCMVDWGVPLSLPLSTETIDGVTVYTVNDGDLVACFGKPITDNVVKALADKAPLRVLFRDSCFEKDELKINIFEQFKQLLSWSDDEALNNIRVI